MKTNLARDGVEPPLTLRQELAALAGVIVMGLAVALVFLFAIKGFVDWLAGK